MFEAEKCCPKASSLLDSAMLLSESNIFAVSELRNTYGQRKNPLAEREGRSDRKTERSLRWKGT